jgi:hypothetical protein
VFAQVYYPGWRVLVDGRVVDVGQHDTLMAVPLAGHERTMVWEYRPSWIWPAFLSALLVLMATAWAVLRLPVAREKP